VPTNRDETMEFGRALAELEGLVERMEKGELSLEESLRCFERGVELTRICQQTLREAEQRVQVLLEKEGRPEIVDFDREP
jgi:exodeoxyribonuclease VII small subunit